MLPREPHTAQRPISVGRSAGTRARLHSTAPVTAVRHRFSSTAPSSRLYLDVFPGPGAFVAAVFGAPYALLFFIVRRFLTSLRVIICVKKRKECSPAHIEYAAHTRNLLKSAKAASLGRVRGFVPGNANSRRRNGTRTFSGCIRFPSKCERKKCAAETETRVRTLYELLSSKVQTRA